MTRREAKAAGLKRYNTGIPCAKAGHIADRYTADAKCIACKLVLGKRYRDRRGPAPKKKYTVPHKNVVEHNRRYRRKHKETYDRATRAYNQRPHVKLRKHLRDRLRNLLVAKRKGRSTLDWLGCSALELCEHIERMFRRGMSWENYGSEWHLDHIRPLADFDLADDSQLLDAYHFTNLRPLWKQANLKKGSRRELLI